MKKLITLTLICFPMILLAQLRTSIESKTLIYKISNQQAITIAQQGMDYEDTPITNDLFTNFIDSFSTKKYKKELPIGNYVFVQAKNEQVHYSFRNVNKIFLHKLQHGKGFRFYLTSSTGQLIKNATVTFDDKKVKYDPKTQYYERKTQKEEGLMIVKAGNQVAFFEVEDDTYQEYDSFWERFEYIDDWKIWNGYWWKERFVYRPWRSTVFRFNQLFKKTYNGYIITNKPMYQPHDTVRLKAYITNKKGKPLNRLLYLELKEGYNKTILTTTLEPTTKGNYQLDFPLADSLKLDKRYTFFLYKTAKKRHIIKSISFKYEDYELSKVEYTLRTDKDKFNIYDPIQVYAEGKDKNGLTQPDVRIKMTVTTQSIQAFKADEVIVKDTIWEYNDFLDPKGETRIEIPKENLPQANLVLRIKANFSNSNGVFDTKTKTIIVSVDTTYLKANIVDGVLTAEYIKFGKSIPQTAILTAKGEKGVQEKIKTIQLPYEGKIDWYLTDYTIKVKDVAKYLKNDIQYDVHDKYDRMTINNQRTKDSILISINNPIGIIYAYKIFKEKKLVAKGNTTASYWVWSGKDTKKSNFMVECFQKEQGSIYEYIPYPKSLLNVTVDQPTTIRPNQTVDIKVNVRKKSGANAKNVNLTALALNTQLPNPNPNMHLPGISYKLPKRPKNKRNYDISTLEVLNQESEYINRKWYKTLELQKDLFYEMRFSNKSRFKRYVPILDTLSKNEAQFSIYLMEQNRAVPIYLIYYNRQLVYYNGVHTQPYSFKGQSGKNTITVRTLDAEYLIQNVELKQGQKLELGINLNQFDKQVRRDKKPKHLTIQEQQLLDNQIIWYRNTSGFTPKAFQQGNQLQIVSEQRGTLAFGPFIRNKKIKFTRIPGYVNQFQFESGFEYDILKNRERLYKVDKFNKTGGKYHLPKNKKLAFPNEFTYTENDIKRLYPIERKATLSELFEQKKENLKQAKSLKRHGKYQYQIPKEATKDNAIAGVFVVAKNSDFRQLNTGATAKLDRLPTDTITIYIYTQDSFYFKKSNIPIQNYQLLFQNLTKEFHLKKDTSAVILNTFLKEWADFRNHKLITYKKPNISKNTTVPSNWNGRRIIGKVNNSGDGLPLIGATILVEGTEYGTSADIDGNYSIEIPNELENPRLQFSYTGCTSQSVSIGNSTVIDITLSEDMDLLDQVVVVGYGTQRKMKTNAMLSVKAVPELMGQVAGVSIGKSKSNMNMQLELPKPSLTTPDIQLRTKFKDYAYWQPNLITDQNGEAFFRVTYPDNITNWNTVVLGMDRKKRFGIKYQSVKAYKELMAQLELPRFLVEGDKTNLIGKTLNYSADTIDVTTTFKVNDAVVQTNTAALESAIIDKYELKAPDAQDSLKLTYTMQTPKYGDGEERFLKIFPKGTEETEGEFIVFDTDTTVTLNFDESKGNVTLYAEKDVLDVLIKDIEYLKNYRYGCNEQTASKLLALLLEKEIRTHLNQPFKDEKKIGQMIARLKKTQNPNGSWGWWQSGSGSYWITTYILKVLHKAKTMGYPSPILEKGLVYLTNELPQIKGRSLLKSLALFDEIGTNLDYKSYTDTLDRHLYSINDTLTLLKIRQHQKLPYNLNHLLKLENKTLFGNILYGKERYYWSDNSFELSLLAYQILKNEPRHRYKLPKIRNYFIEKRSRRYRWHNTFVTANILAEILPDILQQKGGGEPKLVIKGNENQTITKFPYKGKFYPNQALTVEKTGGLPVYFTAYQQFFNSNPIPKADIFELKTTLKQKGKTTKNLKAAEAAQLQVTLQVKQKANYVMVEVPIPAGCSYGSKNSWQSRTRYEVHREYFRHQTAIFFEDLPVGTYTFMINLAPRFTGTYTLNPAKAEQMYFPVFYGRNGLKEVKVK